MFAVGDTSVCRVQPAKRRCRCDAGYRPPRRWQQRVKRPPPPRCRSVTARHDRRRPFTSLAGRAWYIRHPRRLPPPRPPPFHVRPTPRGMERKRPPALAAMKKSIHAPRSSCLSPSTGRIAVPARLVNVFHGRAPDTQHVTGTAVNARCPIRHQSVPRSSQRQCLHVLPRHVRMAVMALPRRRGRIQMPPWRKSFWYVQ